MLPIQDLSLAVSQRSAAKQVLFLLKFFLSFFFSCFAAKRSETGLVFVKVFFFLAVSQRSAAKQVLFSLKFF